ncbi:cytosine deaminase [Saccharomycopsis crataegensis]|uniref:Cytosine deaminase n=1 Tax=Saccharomycopsis crataegensis TaxID=43959 RepID=A0AAV5QWP1_9ASCO|nr:cytosine deaminase [Saccharomycopsis crataegensis]
MGFDDELGMQIAYEEAMKGYEEGGIPIGSCLVDENNKVLGRGHNLRIQKGSAVFHGETSALENAGRLPGSVYKKCTLYSTLSPCHMCTGAALLYGVGRVVFGENDNFLGAEDLLKEKGVELINVQDQRCKDIMAKFIKERPTDWYEDIGV